MNTRPPMNRPMLIGGVAFIGFSVVMIVRGVLHTLSGVPIEDADGTSSGPETVFVGLAGLALGVFAIRLARRGDTES